MKTKYLLLALVCSMIVFISGCRTSPIYNIENQSVVANKSDFTEEDVKKAIVRAGAGLGWNMDADKTGHVLGTLYLRDHMAQVDINYNLESYSITYKDSTNLNYEAAGEESTDASGATYINKTEIIHSNYNGWVQNLDRGIKTQLNQL